MSQSHRVIVTGINAAGKSLEAITKSLTSTGEAAPADETAPAAAVTS